MEMDFSRIQARLSRNYEKQIMSLAVSDRVLSGPMDADWLAKLLKKVQLIRKNFLECEIFIQTGRLPYRFIMSEAGREVERKLYMKGEWDG